MKNLFAINGKIYYHFEEIAGKTLPLYARLLKNRPEFTFYSGWLSLSAWILLLLIMQYSDPKEDLLNKSLVSFFNKRLYLRIEVLKTVDAPSLVAFLVLFMYF